MSLPQADESRAVIWQPSFIYYLTSRGLSEFADQMASVTIGWQVYALTGSAFQLGLVGLVQFLPTAILVFVAGHVVDLYDRRIILRLCQIANCLTAGFLAWGTYGGWLTVPEIFTAVAILGIATAFESPAGSAILPAVVPEGALQRGTAVSTGLNQIAMISGPALGGLAYAIAPGTPYLAMTVCWLVAALASGLIRIVRPVVPEETPSFGALFAGAGFVRHNPAILGTISLDLFAVLLGGATALLPIYAHDILHTGPWGLGLLRAAPAVGALLMTAALAGKPLNRRVGMRMFQAVIAFGIMTIVFAFSRSIILSLVALALMGAADAVSVVIRVSLVQLATPDAMRGRVGAVNYLFVNASNQLGGFESGMAAALVGAVPAVALGGIGTIAVALLWMKLFPTLRDVDRLE